eukprot:3995197-Amphidinium_carterae.1
MSSTKCPVTADNFVLTGCCLQTAVFDRRILPLIKVGAIGVFEQWYLIVKREAHILSQQARRAVLASSEANATLAQDMAAAVTPVRFRLCFGVWEGTDCAIAHASKRRKLNPIVETQTHARSEPNIRSSSFRAAGDPVSCRSSFSSVLSGVFGAGFKADSVDEQPPPQVGRRLCRLLHRRIHPAAAPPIADVV